MGSLLGICTECGIEVYSFEPYCHVMQFDKPGGVLVWEGWHHAECCPDEEVPDDAGDLDN